MLVEKSLNMPLDPRKNWFWQLRPLATRLLRVPGFSFLRPLAARAASVALPAGAISFKAVPAKPYSSKSSCLTVLSANLNHDWPRYRNNRQRLESVAQLIESESVDVIVLQEVARTPRLRSDEWLAQRLGMAYVYARANGHESAIGFEEGLAVFSRFPLAKPVLTELGQSLNPFVRRVGLGVNVILQQAQLPVFSVHLGLSPGQNAVQLDQLQRWIRQLTGQRPALVCGDFNVHESAPRLKKIGSAWLDIFRHVHPHGDGTTHEMRLPWGAARRRLDYQFFHGERSRWQVQEARHLEAPDSPFSDHRAVLTRLINGPEPARRNPADGNRKNELC